MARHHLERLLPFGRAGGDGPDLHGAGKGRPRRHHRRQLPRMGGHRRGGPVRRRGGGGSVFHQCLAAVRIRGAELRRRILLRGERGTARQVDELPGQRSRPQKSDRVGPRRTAPLQRSHGHDLRSTAGIRQGAGRETARSFRKTDGRGGAGRSERAHLHLRNHRPSQGGHADARERHLAGGSHLQGQPHQRGRRGALVSAPVSHFRTALFGVLHTSAKGTW